MAAAHPSFTLQPLAAAALGNTPLTGPLLENLHGRHLLLTGATGFFGNWLLALLAALRERGADIRVTAVSRNPSGFLERSPAWRDASWLHWLACDVRRLDEIRNTTFDLVLHAAADTSTTAHARPLELFETIIHGAHQVLDLAVRSGARRILFTGSGAQYGTLFDGVPVTEDAPLACRSEKSTSAYGEAKRAQETLAAIHARQSGIEPVMTRCFAFAGPGLPLDAHFAIGNFVRDAIHAPAIVLESSGESVRSYLHGADLAIWLLFLLLHGRAGEAYNVGSDHAISIADLAYRVRDCLAPDKPVRILGQPGGARSYYVPDIRKARAAGLEVWTSLDQSIENMGQWARKQ